MLTSTEGTKYPYSDTDTLDVKFKADKGYSVTGITVDGNPSQRMKSSHIGRGGPAGLQSYNTGP